MNVIKLKINTENFSHYYNSLKTKFTEDYYKDYDEFSEATISAVRSELNFLLKELDLGSIVEFNENLYDPYIKIKTNDTEKLKAYIDAYNFKPTTHFDVIIDIVIQDEIDYSKLSKKDIDSLVNIALDNKDYELLNKLKDYVGESILTNSKFQLYIKENYF